MPNPKRLLDALYGVNMQHGGSTLDQFYQPANPMAAKAAKQKQMRESTPETPLGALSRGFATGLFGSTEEQVPYTGSIMEGSPERQQSQANLRELGRNIGAMTDIGGMVTPFAKPAAQAVTRGATALGKAGLEQVDRAMFGEGPLAALVAPVAPMNVNAPVSKLGFYNPIEETATTMQRKQGPGQAFLNEFTKAGISKQRLEDAGIAQKLAATPNITREEVQALTKGTLPDVEEVVLSRSVIPPYMKGFANLHMPNLNVNDSRQVYELRRIANERYKAALEANDLDAAEFAMKAEEDITKFNRTHSHGTKPGERLTEFHEYQEPGGKNYREVLLKAPVKRISEEEARRVLNAKPDARLTDYDIEYASRLSSPEFRSAHWSDPNVISHIRMNDRVDADNKNVLFIEELQSDWAQEGRKKGFAPKDFNKQISEGEKRLEELRDQLADIKSKLDQPGLSPEESKSLMDEYIKIQAKQSDEIDWGNRLYDARSSGVPEGPFIKSTNEWVDLSLKNIIKRAVDEGYDRVAFIDGYKSFLRFPQGADGESTEAGMRKFYDEIVPGRLKALVGKDNVRTIPGITQQRPLDVSLQGDRYYVVDADTDIAIPDHPGFRSLERAEQYLDELYSKTKSMEQIGFDITPEIREKFSKPIPYKKGGAVKRVHISDNPDTMLLELTRAPRMQEGGKLPPGVRRAISQQRGTVAPIPGIKKPAEFIGGYVGADPRFSVMDPDADALERAYRAGEATSVIGDIAGSISPFATASTLARANALPGAAAVKAGAKKPKRASEAIAKFQDPQTTKIQEWQWKPLAEVNQQLKLAEVPDYIQRGYGDFMIEQGKRAAAGNLGVRDLIKAYGITQSSIGRGGLSYETATKAGLKVPKGEGLVRPEGAFAEWLGSKQGQKFLDDAERGVVNEKALDDIRAKFAPFGKANQLTEQLRYGVNNMSTLVPQMQKALVGPADEYRDWAESMKGIAGAKSGFIGSMLGRGDLPTLDARQLNLHALEAPVAPQTMMQRGKGLGAREAVDRLAARQSALGLDIDPSLDPYYQHLAHHAVWDKVADEKTTHDDLMRALRGYKEGGKVHISDNPDTMLLELTNAPKMQAGGAALKAFRDQLEAQYKRSLAKDPRFKQAPGQVTNLAGKSYSQWAAEQQYKHELEDALARLSGVPERKMSIQDLPVGSRLVSIIGDRTQADKILRSVNETPLANEVILHGGPRFGQGKLAQGKEDFWASQAQAAQGVQNRIDAAAERAKGNPVIGVYTAMSAKDSDMYAKHFAESLIEQYPFTGMTGKQVDAFNKEFRKKYPQFAGVDNPEFVDQIMTNTDMRKAFVNEHLKKKNIEKFNIPDGLATRHAITVPELRDVPTGLAGYSVGEMKPGMALEKGSYLEHPTYNTVIPGRFMGGLEIMHDYRDLFPEATQRMRQTLKNNPKFQGPDARDPESQMFGTFGFQGAEQEVTQKLIDELAAREQLIKQLGILPYKKGGKVKKVKISDNSDAMQLELMRKKKHG